MVGANLEGVGDLGGFAVAGFQLAFAEMPEPVEFTAAVLLVVELLEAGVCLRDDLGDVKGRVGGVEGPERCSKDLRVSISS